jgi:glutaredoxin
MIPQPLKNGYTIYGAQYCNYCQKAKEWCYNNNVTFMYVNINDFIKDNSELFDNFKDVINNQKTIPLIFRNSDFIGGWTDFMNINNQKVKLELNDDF